MSKPHSTPLSTSPSKRSAATATTAQPIASKVSKILPSNAKSKCRMTSYCTFHSVDGALTRQVRMKRQGGQVVQNCDAYLGRQCNMGGWRLPKSPLFNPFSVKACQSNAFLAVRKYAKHLRSSKLLLAKLPELQGKRLGCWCAVGQACHARLVAALVNEATAEVMDGESTAMVAHIEKSLDMMLGNDADC